MWLNGHRIGTHTGAFLPFELALPAADLHLDAVNRLVLRISDAHALTDLPPSSSTGPSGVVGGWWNYGGILREVYLRRVQAIDDFPEQLAELMAYLDASFPEGHPLARLALTLPGRPVSPALWLLGSSPQSAIWAGELGLPYSFADFINPAGAEIAALYRERFVPSETLGAPRLSVAVSAICANSILAETVCD